MSRSPADITLVGLLATGMPTSLSAQVASPDGRGVHCDAMSPCSLREGHRGAYPKVGYPLSKLFELNPAFLHDMRIFGPGIGLAFHF